ncbi:DnaJ domain, partial [Trinorchestia longiramus]
MSGVGHRCQEWGTDVRSGVPMSGVGYRGPECGVEFGVGEGSTEVRSGWASIGVSVSGASPASAMDSILSYNKSKEPDYYEILGCNPSSSEEQIQAEYRNRAVMLHPDKNPGDEHSVHRFQLLQ